MMNANFAAERIGGHCSSFGPRLSRLAAPMLILGAFGLWIDVANKGLCSDQRRAPNIVLVLTDDQGYGDLSCHGNPALKTPALDRLHAESIRFTDFHVSPMCTPTRGQLLTGRDALANGAYCVCSGRTFLRSDTPTMAEVFAANGYRTGIFGKWHLGDNYPHRPNDRGFHEAVYHLGWGITSVPDYWDNDYTDDTLRHNGRLQRYPGYCTDVFFAEATRWMQTCAARQQPFFVYLALNAPHGPFYVPEKYRRPYQHLAPDVAGFFGMLANLDENVARLDAWLNAAKLRENTIFIFLTDNGGTGGISVYNAGMRGAKASLYEGGHRVPCFLRWPAGKLRGAGDVDTLAECQDLLPTLMDLCGLQKMRSTRFDGVSLAPLLRNRPQPELEERKLVVQYGGLLQSQPAAHDAAVMWGKWRLVGGKELYNLAADAGQKFDVAAQHADVAAKLREHYNRWWAGVQPALAEHGRITVGSAQENPSCLTSMDWLVPKLTPCAQPFDIRLAGRTEVKEGSLPLGRPTPVSNGPWNLEIAQAGDYEISLRRWPQEADAPLSAAVPAVKHAFGEFPAGLALPIAKARLRVAGVEQTRPVAAADKAAVFTARLPAGPTQLQTWFYDPRGVEIGGAYYVYIRRK